MDFSPGLNPNSKASRLTLRALSFCLDCLSSFLDHFQDLSTFKTVVDINLVGTFNVSRLVAARIVKDLPNPVPKPNESTQDAGVIINTASAAGLEGQVSTSFGS